MKNNIQFYFLIVILYFSITNPVAAKKTTDKLKEEISRTLEQWNTASKNADLEKFMAMFDNSDNIILVGSADGEISKGRDQVREWLSQLYGFAGFSWEMNRIDMDCNGNTAWVFVEGAMIVNFHKGGTKKTPYRFTGIMVKKKGEWKWRLFNGSVPQQE